MNIYIFLFVSTFMFKVDIQSGTEAGCQKQGRLELPMDVPMDVYMRALASPTVAVLEEILAGISWRNDKRRVAPAGKGANDNVPLLRMTLGLVSARHAGPALSLETPKRPRLCIFLAKLLEVQCPGARATSIALAAHGSASMHIDYSNVGASYVVTCGKHAGGRLWIADGSADGMGVPIVIKGEIKQFDAQRPHVTLPFSGSSRYTVTYYSHRCFERAGGELKRRLEQSTGLRIPASRSFVKDVAALSALAPKRKRLQEASAMFDRFRSKFPSRIWPRQSHHKPHAWICKGCGKSGSQQTGTQKHWCSDACKNASRRATVRGVATKCKYKKCGKEFVPVGSSGPLPKYCSRACRRHVSGSWD